LTCVRDLDASATGILREPPYQHSDDDDVRLDFEEEFLTGYQGDVITFGSLFYTGRDVPVEPPWHLMMRLIPPADGETASSQAQNEATPAGSRSPRAEEAELLLREAKVHRPTLVGNTVTVHVRENDVLPTRLPEMEDATAASRWETLQTYASVIWRRAASKDGHMASVSYLVAKEAGSRGGTSAGSRANDSWRSVTPSRFHLDFESWGLDDGYVKALCAHLSFPQARHINMSDNRLTDRSIRRLEKMHGGWRLETLRLAKNSLKDFGGIALARFLEFTRPPLKSLDLSDNLIGDRACKELCVALADIATNFQELRLARNQIGRDAQSGIALGKLVRSSETLVELDLHWNRLCGDGAIALLEGLLAKVDEAKKRFQFLDLSWNWLGLRCSDRRGTALLSNKPGSKALQPEDPPVPCPCSSCVASKRIAEALAAMIQDGSISHLNVSYNSLGTHECAIVGSGLRRNPAFSGLIMLGNGAALDEMGSVVTPLPDEVKAEIV